MQEKSNYIQSVIRALSTLEAFFEADELGIKELSEITGLPTSTIQRIVDTLEVKNYLVQNPSTLKYQLGIATYRLTERSRQNYLWVQLARKHIEKLSEKYDETVNLAIVQGENVVYLDSIETKKILRPSLHSGMRFPLFCTGLGKCILAYQPDAILEEHLKKPIRAFTARSLTEPEDIRVEMEKIRRKGISIDDEEFQDGLVCMAAPILNNKGHSIAAISMSVPMIRLSATLKASITEDLIKTAKLISEEIRNTLASINAE